MKLLNDLQETIQSLEVGCWKRCAWEYLRDNAIGHANAKPYDDISKHLEDHGHFIPKNKFQNQLVKHSRAAGSKAYIGWSGKGFFIVVAHDDVKVVSNTYVRRMTSEKKHLDNLNSLAAYAGINVSL